VLASTILAAPGDTTYVPILSLQHQVLDKFLILSHASSTSARNL
jgi:hypothetical protein